MVMLARILDGGELLMLSMDKVIDVVPLQRIKLKKANKINRTNGDAKKSICSEVLDYYIVRFILYFPRIGFCIFLGL